MNVHFSFDAVLAWAEQARKDFCWVADDRGTGLHLLQIDGRQLLHAANRRLGTAQLVLPSLTSIIAGNELPKVVLSQDVSGFSIRIPSPLKDEARYGQSLFWGSFEGDNHRLRAVFGKWPYTTLPNTIEELLNPTPKEGSTTTSV